MIWSKDHTVETLLCMFPDSLGEVNSRKLIVVFEIFSYFLFQRAINSHVI